MVTRYQLRHLVSYVLKFADKMAEAPEDLPEESDVTEQAGDNVTDPADLEEKPQAEEAASHQDAHQSQPRATSPKKKKKKAKAGGVKKSDNDKASVPMSNVKNLQELINKLSSMPSSLTAALSETDGPSNKGHEFWDTQPVPKLGNV